MPAVIPVNTPVVEPTVATAVLLLAHVPPAGEPVSVIVAPAHMVDPPPVIVAPDVTVKERVT